jgi:hypothetical protein
MMFEKLFERSHALKPQLAGPLVVEERQWYLIHGANEGMKIGTLKTTAHYRLLRVTSVLRPVQINL